VASYPRYYQIKDAKALPDGERPQAVLDRLKKEIPHDYERLTDMDGVASIMKMMVSCERQRHRAKVRVFSEGKTEKRLWS